MRVKALNKYTRPTRMRKEKRQEKMRAVIVYWKMKHNKRVGPDENETQERKQGD